MTLRTERIRTLDQIRTPESATATGSAAATTRRFGIKSWLRRVADCRCGPASVRSPEGLGDHREGGTPTNYEGPLDQRRSESRLHDSLPCFMWPMLPAACVVCSRGFDEPDQLFDL